MEVKRMRNGIIALALIFSLMLASMPAAISAATDENPCTEGTCGADYDVTLTELEGAEKEKAIADALKDEEVKGLFLVLVKTGYTPGIDDAMAFTEEDSGVIAVVIMFEQRDTGELAKPAEIVWVYNPETGTVMVMLANGWWECILCGIGCGAACELACIVGAIFTWGGLYFPCTIGCALICNLACEGACS